MSNINANCAVCGKALNDSWSCEACKSQYSGVALFANQQSFSVWKKSVQQQITILKAKSIEAFRNNKISLFPTEFAISLCNEKRTDVYNGDGRCKSLEGIAQYSSGARHNVMLKSDGSVTAEGGNLDGQCNLSDLSDISFVLAGANCTYAVTKQGDVIVRGFSPVEKIVTGWKNVVKLVGDNGRVAGLTKNGEVLIADDSQTIDVKVTGALDIDTTYNFTVWLNKDHSIGCYGNQNDGRNEIVNCKDALAVAVENRCAIALKKDGSVFAVGKSKSGLGLDRDEVKNWKNLINIACSNSGILGIFEHGTIKIVGNVDNKSEIQRDANNSKTKYGF